MPRGRSPEPAGVSLRFPQARSLHDLRGLRFQRHLLDRRDCFHRFLVRMEETPELLCTIEQAIENLPGKGPVSVDIKERIVPSDKEKVYNTIEGCITHFEVIMIDRDGPMAERYSATGSPNGGTPSSPQVIEGIIKPRARCRPRVLSILPCFRT